MLKRCCGSVNSKFECTIKRLTRYKQVVILAAMLEGKVVPSNMAANTNHTTLLKKSNCHKISPLNGFALKVGMQDNFDVLCPFLASAGHSSFKRGIGHVTS